MNIFRGSCTEISLWFDLDFFLNLNTISTIVLNELFMLCNNQVKSSNIIFLHLEYNIIFKTVLKIYFLRLKLFLKISKTIHP